MHTSPMRYDMDGMLLDVRPLEGPMERAKAVVLQDWETGKQGWLGAPDDHDGVKAIVKLAAAKKKYSTCLVIGIGGSDLGTRAAWQILGAKAKGMKLEFLGNTDPDEIAAVLGRIDLRKTLVNVISKSGDTLEPMSVFMTVRDLLKKRGGEKALREQIVATTDPARGSLRALAERDGFATLSIPSNVGGRFSVLTSVGLFPLACAGVDVKKLLRGAKEVRDRFVSERAVGNEAVRFAALHVLHGREHGRTVHVCMPYSSRLELFGKWYRQLWAESLGKREDRKGDTVHSGPTPVAALGAVDQHSQIQLYMEGPDNKVVTFIEVDRFDATLRASRELRKIEPLAYVAGKTFADILHAERRGTAEALASVGRPQGTIVLPRLEVSSLGALFMFYEIATAVAGELLGVNPYDQPGVEEGKRRMRSILGKEAL